MAELMLDPKFLLEILGIPIAQKKAPDNRGLKEIIYSNTPR